MSVTRISLVVILVALLLSLSLLPVVEPAPLQAQCEPGSANCEPPSPPPRCPPGSHPVGPKDCALDDPSGIQPVQLTGSGEEITIQATIVFTGAPLEIIGNLQDSDPDLHRRVEAVNQTCGGYSIYSGVNYKLYPVVNGSGQALTVDVAMEASGSPAVSDPFLLIYDNDPTDPTAYCMKADDDTASSRDPLIGHFSWNSGDTLYLVATNHLADNDKDEGGFKLKITSTGPEYEPHNDDLATARPISPNVDWMTAEINSPGDVDYYSFPAKAGQQAWIYVRTDQSGTSRDSEVKLLLLVSSDPVITATIAEDNDSGGQGDNSSAIAGAGIPIDGTYLVQVNEVNDDEFINPYYLYVYLTDQDPVTDESDIEGRNPPHIFEGTQSGGEDLFGFTVSSRNVIFAGLNSDGDNDGQDFDGTLTLYDPGSTAVLAVDSEDGSPRAEALSYGQVSGETVEGGLWQASVISNTTGPGLTYHLLAGSSPITQGNVIYSRDVNKTIPTSGTVTSVLTSGQYCMTNLDIWLDLDHQNLDDLDLTLAGPDGTTVDLFRDRGGDEDSLVITLDDAGLAPLPDNGVTGSDLKIGGRYRTDASVLTDFANKNGLGRWALTVTDDTVSNTGTLNNWALIMHCVGRKNVYLPIIIKS